MSAKKNPDLSEKDLKSLKKEELIRIILKGKDSGTPFVVRAQRQFEASQTRSPSLSGGNSRPDIDVDWLTLQIKTAVVEAVQSVKSDLQAEYKAKYDEIKSELGNEIAELRLEVNNLKSQINIQAKNLEKEFLNDMRETDVRKNNVMLFGLQESNAQLSSDCKEHDLNLIQKLASELGVNNVEVSDCHRLGRRSEKPRPVKVTCRSLNQRADLLRLAPRISRMSSSLGFERVFIKPDLTPKEQEANRLLRQELKNLREAGERVVIRGGQIVAAQNAGQTNRY